MRRRIAETLTLTLLVALTACGPDDEDERELGDHGSIAEGISAPMGQPIPTATADQLEAFERGAAVALHRFTLEEGLGPAFNVTFCGSCHERPTPGGSAGTYRNFFIGGELDEDGAFFPTQSAGPAGGVVRFYRYEDGESAHPELSAAANVIAQRNPIPFFGVGLIAEIPESEILRHADPDDADGDGISGRPNFDRMFVGRFGRKSQTVSIEGFIRGPLFNHLGVTTDPLSEAQRAQLPVDSSGGAELLAPSDGATQTLHQAQAAAPDGPLTDNDGADDPEMTTDELFDLVSFAMLMAAPEIEPRTEQTDRGAIAFDRVGCDGCHVPRLIGPRGPIPLYSDLLLHDMGPELDDGLQQGEATGAEFRTQPLWGLAAVGPYLHDGRATTVREAIEFHGGEGTASRDGFLGLTDDEQADLIEFLLSLGGRAQYSTGLVPPDTPMTPAGEYGGPSTELQSADADRFLAGRELFDHEFGFADGLGSPRFNGDSCRACHFEPTIGGAGPRGVNVIRHGIANPSEGFVPPVIGTILHRLTALEDSANRPQAEATIFELRQTPHLYGLGLIESIDGDAILANADPNDSDADGISGRVSSTDGGRLGRFGWKAQVPTVAEFVRDAVHAELGMTLEFQEGLSFGRIQDNDAIPDPEFSAAQAETLAFYLSNLGPPPRQVSPDPEAAARGETVFDEVGCASCHIPSLPGAAGPVPLYSDLLLHEVLPAGALGIEEASANVREFRTAPLWGISQTAPYLHNGAADTLEDAIGAHAGEADAAREAFEALSADDRAALVIFLETL